MGLTKQYLAYRAVDSFNIIASGRANVNFAIYNKIEGRYITAAAAENVILWDLKLGERVLTLRRGKQEVTALRVSPDRLHVAVGYLDGAVEIFDLSNGGESVCSLALHKSAISVLRYDDQGIRLITGSLDTELVIVDILEQAGRQRLIGHNAPITDAHFLERLALDNIAVSSSKDTQIKFWNLETQFCFKTIVDNRTEIWALAFTGTLMVAGCGESTMNVYRLTRRDPNDVKSAALEKAIEGLSVEDDDTISPLNVMNCGFIQRAGKGRCVNLVTDPSERVLSCHGTNDLIENFYFCTKDEAKQRLAKRLKKVRKAKQSKELENEPDNLEKDLSLSDEIKRLNSIKTKQKIKSLDILLGGLNELRILVSLANNSVQLYSVKTTAKDEDARMLRSLYWQGHQSEVRSVCLSSDALAIGSGSAESFKLWDRDSMQCLRSISTDYILSSIFAPGDRYILLGLKSGKLLIVDVGAADIVEEIPAHNQELWSIILLPDKKGCATGSSDCTVKLWTFELIDNNDKQMEVEDTEDAALTTNVKQVKVLSLLHKNTLKLEEAVLAIQISPNMKYLAVGLLDSTVKVFFLDTFKFYLSLYGHKLPILCLDISYDSTIIATGSADRNVKIWGLDFGDCHRSLFAHDDSVMSLRFIANTHMFFTCGKDGNIKQWDADSFNKIITLPGHIGEAYNLAISSNGRHLVTCGSDRTLRLFERTDEPIVLQDIQEEEREEKENEQLATGDDHNIPLLPGLKLASKKTVGSEKAAETILECLNICKEYELESDIKPTTTLHPLMKALNVKTTIDFLLITLERIRASDLEEALLLLPFSIVCELLERLPSLIEERSDEIELLSKVTMFLFKIHMKPISGAKHMKSLLERLINLLTSEVNTLRDCIGFNLHSLSLLQNELEKREGIELFYEAIQDRKKREKKRRQRETLKRQLIQM
uniref:WD_REPEATS_REGION domain-containing protein n=1 Tax=Glossina brevipalpis TaxID=37001 RepID=A0A1A9WRW0_9MUSC